MAVWWITEALPLPATALLPIALFPLLGVVDIGAATAPYANDLIFLFMGGFMIALRDAAVGAAPQDRVVDHSGR
jgi:sodium-dependent dicarboxylate transporter 2/3/5